MRERWTESRLGDLAVVDRGVSWAKAQEHLEPLEGSVPVVRIGNVKSTCLDMSDRLYVTGLHHRDRDRKAITPHTIVMVGSNGNADRVGNAFLAGSQLEGHVYASFLIGITPTRDVLPAYLWMFLQSSAIQRQITEATAGSTGLKNLSLRWVRNLTVTYPSLAEQRRIVDLVSTIDRVASAQEQEAAALMSLRAAAAADLCFGGGWPLVPVSELAVHKGLVGGPFGSSLVSRDYVAEGVPVIRGTNMSRYVGGEFVHVSEEKADSLRNNLALPGDVIFTQRGTLGQVALVPRGRFSRYVVSQSQMRLRPEPSRVLAEYVYVVFSTERVVRELLSKNTATANPHINLGILAKYEVPVPALATQQEIVQVINGADEAQDAAQGSVRAQRLLRSTVLSDLLARHVIPHKYDCLLRAS